jgi:hypothetical protein
VVVADPRRGKSASLLEGVDGLDRRLPVLSGRVTREEVEFQQTCLEVKDCRAAVALPEGKRGGLAVRRKGSSSHDLMLGEVAALVWS